MSSPTAQIVAMAIAGIGWLTTTVISIWGERIKDCLLGPRLELSLLDAKGDLTRRGNATQVYYYHLRVKNRRSHSVAKSVRVLMQRVSRKAPGGSFIEEPIVYPLQFAWTPFEWHEADRTVFDTSTCDFGFLDNGATAFVPAVRVVPNNFRGFVAAGETVRYEVVATGPNVYFSKRLFIEVSWNGQWTADIDAMRRNFVIREVPSL